VHRPLPETHILPGNRGFRLAGYDRRVAEREACLVDVYDTLLSCDFVAHTTELPPLAGLTAEAFGAEYRQLRLALGIGQMSKAEGFARILRAGGAEPRPDLVRAMVDRDRELLLESAQLYDDALPFLRELKSRGIKIAIVSNCSENTRDLLESNGVAALADSLVLSCEVGAEKPAAEIFTYALDRLGVLAHRAVFVDDQPAYCAGAADLGITAVQILRGELDGKVPAEGTTVVRSLSDVVSLFGALSGADQGVEEVG
jgi:putative hydrolase of the HAD superfamily